MKSLRGIPLLMSAVLLSHAITQADIDPHFTPIQLVEESLVVLKVRLRKTPGEPQQLTARVSGCLKGSFEAETLPIDLSSALSPEDATQAAKMVGDNPGDTGVLFVGTYQEKSKSSGKKGAPTTGLLHYVGTWIRLSRQAENAWGLVRIDSGLEGTWAGGTDMLLRAVEYILTDPNPTVPVTSRVSWGEPQKIAKLDGKVYKAEPVDLEGKGEYTLFIAAEKGDHVFTYNAATGTLKDVTTAHQLSARSRYTTWGDFNGDERLDLASWDGRALRLFLQSPQGTFRALVPTLSSPLKDCLGLTSIYTGNPNRSGIVVSTSRGPVLLYYHVRNMPEGIWFVTHPLVTEEDALRKINELGTPGGCLVADLDLDSIPDILQLFSRGAVFCKSFTMYGYLRYIENPVFPRIALGEGRGAVFFGDYDGDGQLDVFTVAEDRPRLWQNIGVGKFIERTNLSGEIAAITQAGSIGGMTGDINNDGRQDILLLYSDRPPQLFFNRGFRSFGYARALDVVGENLLPQAREGQQAGCLGDLNGDGAQDLVLVLKNGAVWFLPQLVGRKLPLSLRVVLPVGAQSGPQLVTGWIGQRPLGGWNMTKGGTGAFFGISQPNTPFRLEWRVGKWVRKKEVHVQEQSVRIVLDPRASGS